MARTSSEIVKGSILQVGLTNSGTVLGFATSHSLSVTVNTTEVSTKDHGNYPGVVAQNTTWEVSCENLFCGFNWDELQQILVNGTPVDISFASVQNWTDKGIVDATGTGVTTEWALDTPIATGKAYLTSLNVNAANGDNATISATFTGAGTLTFHTYPSNNGGGGGNV